MTDDIDDDAGQDDAGGTPEPQGGESPVQDADATRDGKKRGSITVLFPRREAEPEEDLRKAARAVREEYCLRMVTEGHIDARIIRFVSTVFNVSRGTVRRDLSRARKKVSAEYDTTIDAVKTNQYLRYLEIYRTATRQDIKLAALQRIDQLIGTEAPKALRVGPGGVAAEEARKLAERLPTETLQQIAIAQRAANEEAVEARRAAKGGGK